MTQELYTIQEVAALLGVSSKTLRRWEETGVIKPIRTIGNQRRYSADDVRKLQRRKRLRLLKQIQDEDVAIPTPVTPSNASSEPVASQPVIQASLPDPVFPQSLPLPQPTPPARREIPSASSFTTPQPHASRYAKHFTYPLIGGFTVLVMLVGSALVWQWFGGATLHLPAIEARKQSNSEHAVLGADTSIPQFEMNVNVPSIFSKEVKFLSTVDIEKGLTVKGLSQLTGGIKTNNADINAGTGKLNASNVIYSIHAGSNITISGDKQNPTISAGVTGVSSFQGQTGAVTLSQGSGISLNGLTINNTGVLSVQGTTGAVTLTGGNGISISGTTITNSDTGSSQNIFKTFSISGTDITASNNNDTINFAAGSGISLSGDAGTKTITITGSGGGLSGMTPNGVLYATSSTTAGTVVGTTGTVLHGVTAGAPVFSAVNLTADVTGVLPIGNGGTGVGTTPTSGQILIGNGSGYSVSTITQGSGIAVTNGAGTITLSNTGVLSLTGTANQVNVSGSTGAVTISLPQNIGTASAPTFSSLTLSAASNQLTLGSGGNTATITASPLGARSYTLPDVSGGTGTFCILELNNCSGGGGTLGGSGTTNFVAKFTSATGLADSDIFDNGHVGIGTTSPQGLFSVSGGVAGKALVSLDNSATDQNILVGSASGTTRFAFDSNGNLTINGGAYQIGGTDVLTSNSLGTGILSSSLTSVGALNGGSITNGFGNIDTGGNITAEGTTGFSTTGTNAGLTFGTGTGNHIISASSGTLELGAFTLTGDITGNSKNVTGLNNLAAGGTITFSSFTSAGGPLFTNGVGALSQVTAGSSTQVLHGGTTPVFGAVNLTTDITGILPLANGGTNANLTADNGGLVYSNTTGLAILAHNANAGLALVSGGAGTPSWFAPTPGSILFAGANGALSQSNTQLFFDNTNNLLGIGTGTPTSKFDLEGAVPGKALSIFNYTGTDQNILVASKSGTEEFAVNNTGSLQFTGGTSFLNTLNVSGSIASAQTYTLPSTGGTICTFEAGNCGGSGGGITGSGTANRLAKFTGGGTIGNGSINDLASAIALTIDATGNVGIGTATPVAPLQVNGAYGSNAAAVINQLNAGDIFTASAGGATRFTVANNGSVQFTGGSGFLQTLTSNAGAAKTYNLPTFAGSSADICLTTGNCSGIGGSISGSGTAGQLAFFTTSSNISSDTSLFFDSTNLLFGIGNNTPVGKLDLKGAVPGKALAIFNETGNQAIFTASASGTPEFTISHDGTITSGKYTTNGGLLYTDASGNVIQLSSVGTNHQLLHGGASPAYSAVALTTDVSGILPVANGGTGVGTFGGANTLLYTTAADTLASITTANNAALITNGSGAPSWTSATANQVLRANGAGAVAFGSLDLSQSGTVGTSVLGVANGGTGLSSIAAGSLLYGAGTSAANTLSITGTSGECLLSNGSAPVWQACPGGPQNYWQLNSGALSPFSPTADLLLGSNATSSADFAFTGVDSNNPIASVSAFTNGGNKNGISLTAATSTIQSFLNNTLTLGGGSTGNIQLVPGGTTALTALNNGNLVANGTLTGLSGLTSSGTINFTGLGTGLVKSTGGTLSIASAGTDFQAPISAANGLSFASNTVTLGGSLNQATSISIGNNVLTLGDNTGTGNVVVSPNAGGKAALIVNKQGNNDIFAASASGATKFVIANDGTLTTAKYVGNNGVLYANTSGLITQSNDAGSSGQILLSNGGTPTFTTLGGDIASVNGTGSVSLATSGVTANTYGGAGNGVGQFTVDAKGRITAASNRAIGLATADVTGILPVANGGTGQNFSSVVAGSLVYFSATGVMNTIAPGTGSQCLFGGTTPGWGSCAAGSNLFQLNSGALSPFNISNDLLLGGTATTSAEFAFTGVAANTPVASIAATPTSGTSKGLSLNGATNTIQSLNRNTLTFGGNTTGDIAFNPGGAGTALYLGSNGNVGIGGITNPGVGLDVAGAQRLATDTSQALKVQSANGAIIGLDVDTFNGRIGVGTTAPGAALDIRSLDGTLPLATISGKTSFAGLVVDNSGSGDLFTASSSGVPHFTIKNDGTIVSSKYTTNNGLLYTNGNGVVQQLTPGSGSQCLLGNLTWTTCAAGANLLQEIAGAISPANITDDLLLGGTATSSAKFAFINNIGAGTPTASISAQSGNNSALVLGADSTIQSVREQTLTLGGTTTGDIAFRPGGQTAGNSLYLASNGNVGIGTTSPNTGLEVAGTIGASGVLNVRTQMYSVSCSSCINFGALEAVSTGGAIPGGQDRPLKLQIGGGSNATVGIGIIGTGSSTNPVATLDVRGVNATLPIASFSGATTFANTVIDQSGLGDIFTASKSGATKFTILNSGSLQLNNYTTNNGLLYTDGSGIMQQLAPGGGSQCLLGNLTWTTCAAGANLWQENAGAVAPANITDDFLLGGTATSSAKFAFINDIGSGTPTASISAQSGNSSALVLGANSTIQSVRNQTLTLGGNSTGNIQLVPGGTTALTALNNGNLVANGTLTGLTGLTSSGTIQFSGLGASAFVVTDGSKNLTTTAGAASSSELASILSDETGSGFAVFGTSPIFTTSIDGGAGTFGLLGTPTTINFGGAATAINMGASGGTITVGNNGSSTITTGTNGSLTLASAGNGQTLLASDFDSGVAIGSANTTPAGLAINAGIGNNGALIVNQKNNGDIIDASVSGAIKFQITNTGVVKVVGGQTSDIDSMGGATLKIGASSQGGLTLGRSGAATTIVGSNFSAGQVAYADNTNTLAFTSGGSANQCLLNNGTSGPVWGSCALGTNFFQLNSNAISPANSTYDFLLGGTSTASAKFAFINNAGGTPVASVSAQSGNNSALVLGADSTIQSVRNQTLTIGGNTTGNLALASNTIQLTGSAPVITSANNALQMTAGTNTLTLQGGGTAGNIQFFSGSNTLTSSGNLTIAGTLNGNTVTTGTGTLTLGSNTLTVNSNTTLAGGGNTLTLSGGNTTLAGNGHTLTLNANAALNQDVQTTSAVTFASVNGDTITTGTGTLTLGSNTLAVNSNTTLAGGGHTLTLTGDASLNQSVLTSSTPTFANMIDSGLSNSAAVYTDGSHQLTTTAPTTGVIGYFQRSTGALSPTNITDDLLLGGTGTASAKFAFINNIGTGTPTASISGTTANTYAYLDGNGNLATTNKQTLTLGAASTGNIAIGTDATARTLSLGNSTGASAVNITAGSGGIGLTGATTILGATSINTSGSNATNIGTGSNGGTITIGNASSGDLALNDQQWSITGAGAGTFASLSDGGNLAFTGTNPSITNTGSNTLTINSGSTGNIQFFNSSNTISSGGVLTLVGNNTADITTTGTNTLKIDTGGAAGLTIGGTNANALNFGHGTIATTFTGTGLLTIGGNVQINGNNIQDSGAATRVTLGATTTLTNTTTTLSGTTTLTASNLATITSAATLGISATALQLGNGSAATLQTTGNNNITIASGTTTAGTGQIVLSGDFNTGVTIGQTLNTTPAPLVINDGIGNNGAFIVNNLNNGDLIDASASGLTKFQVGNSGTVTAAGLITANGGVTVANTQNLTLAGITGNNQVLYATSGTGAVAGVAATGASGLCLVSGSGAAAPNWQTCGATGLWNLNLGALSPGNISNDLLLGGNATTSAEFAFMGVASNTPVASIAATPASGTSKGLSLNGSTGTLQSLNMNTLNIGGATTGNIVIDSPSLLSLNTANNKAITTGTGLTTLGGNLQVNGNIIQDSGAATRLTLGATTTLTNTTLTLSGTTSIGASSLSTFTMGGAGTVIGGTAAGSSLTLESTSGSGNADFLSFKTGSQAERMRVDTSGNVGIGSNFGTVAAKATLDVRGTSGTTPAASVSASSTFAAAIVDQSGTGDIFTASKSGLTKFTLTNAGLVGVNTSTPFAGLLSNRLYGQEIVSPANFGASTGIAALGLNSLGGGGAMVAFGANNGQYNGVNGASIAFNNNVAGALELGVNGIGTDNLVITNAGNVGIGTNNTAPTATLDVAGNSGTTPAASIQGTTSFATLLVNNNGVGDVFTASKSGATKFTILNNGSVQINSLGTGVVHSSSTGLLSSSTIVNADLATGSFTNITGVGTLTAGTWNATAISSQFGGTGQNFSASSGLPSINGGAWQTNAITQNGVAFGGASNAMSFTAQGGANTILTANGGAPSFSAAPTIGTSVTTPLVIGGTAASSTLTLESTSGTGTSDLIAFKTGSQAERVRIDTNGNVGIGSNFGTVAAKATLDVRGTSGTTPAASISATSSFASLVVNNSGVGDILAASKSGATKFVVKNSGQVLIGGGLASDLDTVTGTSLTIGGANATSMKFGNGTITTTFTGTGLLTTGGDVQVNGNDILDSGGNIRVSLGATTTLTNTTTTLSGTTTLTASSLATLTTAANLSMASTNNVTLSGAAALIGGTAAGSNLTIESTSGTGTSDFLSFKTGSQLERMRIDTNGSVGIGSNFGTVAAKAALDVRGNSGITPIASFSAKTAFAGLLVDNSGAGDLFTASTSGFSRFTIGNIGAITTNAIQAPGINANVNNYNTTFGPTSGIVSASLVQATLNNTAVSSASIFGTTTQLSYTSGTTNFSGDVAGTLSQTNISGGSGNFTGNSGTTAVYGAINKVIIGSGYTGTVARAIGTYSRNDINAGMSSGSAYDFYAADGGGGGAVLANEYGLYLEQMTKGGTNNYEIYTAGGNSAIANGGSLQFLGGSGGVLSINSDATNGNAFISTTKQLFLSPFSTAGVFVGAAGGVGGVDTTFNDYGTVNFNHNADTANAFTIWNAAAIPVALLRAATTQTDPTLKITTNTTNAALVVDNFGSNGDLITASEAGTTRFRMDQLGNTLFQGLTVAATGIIDNSSNPPSETNDYAIANGIGDEGSMVPNAGFESALSANKTTNVASGAIADGWVAAASMSAAVTRVATQSAEGSNSVMIKLNANQSTSIYSACFPIAGAGGGTYNMNYYIQGSSTNIGVGGWLDAYFGQSACQQDGSSKTTTVAQVTRAPASWAVHGGSNLAIGNLTFWARAHFIITCNGSCTNGTTAEIDGVRVIQSALTNGLDYAENYPADPNNIPTAGQVVTLEASGSAQVAPASKYMDNAVIGVVSTKPGEVLDDGSVPDPKVPIALAGRVPVNVSTKNGPIHVGDYLASSDMPGVAVKATDAGPVIGTAMEDDLDTDTTAVKQITVFVKNTYYSGVQIATTGNLSIFENNPAYSGLPVTSQQSPTYGVKDQNGNAVTQNGAYANATVGNLQAGGVTAQSINTQSLILAGQSVTDRLNNLENAASNSAQLSSKVDTLTNNVTSLSDRLASDEAMLNLLASGSALLTQNPATFTASSAAELNLDQLTANNAVINNDLSVLGKTTVADLGVTGHITAGLLSINGLDQDAASGQNAFASLNTSSGPLKIQSFGLNGVDFLNGKLTIDTDGNMQTHGAVTAVKYNVDTGDVAGASLGVGTLPAGQTAVTIGTSAVTSKSSIFVTPRTKTDQQLSVTTQTAGKSFKVEVTGPATGDIKFNWWIVN